MSSSASAGRTVAGEESSGESGRSKLPRLLQTILCGTKEEAWQLEVNLGPVSIEQVHYQGEFQNGDGGEGASAAGSG